MSSHLAEFSSKSDSTIFKISALVGLAGGLTTSLIYYALSNGSSNSGSSDQISILKQALIQELRKYSKTNSISPAKDPIDYTFSRDFMVYIFRTLFTF